MAFIGLVQTDSVSEWEKESFARDGNKRNFRRCQACTLCMVLMGVACIVLVMSIDLIMKSTLEVVGTYALGVKTKVGSVMLNTFSADSSVSKITIQSPDGFDGDLMHLEKGIFDLGFCSLVRHTVLNLNTPIRLEEIRVDGLHVLLAQKLDGTSNVGVVLDHILQATKQRELPMPMPSARAMKTKFIADRIQLGNISASIAVHPITQVTGPVSLTLNTLLLTSLGQKHGGITLEELLQDIVKAVLNAVIHQVGGDLQSRIMEGLGGLEDELLSIPHVRDIYYDAGDGLHKMHEWADGVGTDIQAQILGPLGVNTKTATEAIGGTLSNVSAAVAAQASQISSSISGYVGYGSGEAGGKTGSPGGVSSRISNFFGYSGADAGGDAGSSRSSFFA